MEPSIPLHLAFIVDGNRRWARERGLPTLEGHKKGLSLLEEVAMECFNRGVKYVSFYVFSTENWGRAEEEVSYLMRLVILNVKRLVKRCLENNVKIAVLGSREKVSASESMAESNSSTAVSEEGSIPESVWKS